MHRALLLGLAEAPVGGGGGGAVAAVHAAPGLAPARRGGGGGAILGAGGGDAIRVFTHGEGDVGRWASEGGFCRFECAKAIGEGWGESAGTYRPMERSKLPGVEWGYLFGEYL